MNYANDLRFCPSPLPSPLPILARREFAKSSSNPGKMLFEFYVYFREKIEAVLKFY